MSELALKVSATSSNSGNSVYAKREDERVDTEDLLLHRMMMMMTGCNHASSGSQARIAPTVTTMTGPRNMTVRVLAQLSLSYAFSRYGCSTQELSLQGALHA